MFLFSASLCRGGTTRMQMAGMICFVFSVSTIQSCSNLSIILLSHHIFIDLKLCRSQTDVLVRRSVIPFTVHRQQKYAWGSCSDSSLQLLESASLSFSINWYGSENITSLSSMILMCVPERCILRVFKMLQNFIMKQIQNIYRHKSVTS